MVFTIRLKEILEANGKEIFEDGGVMPNPTVEKLNEGVRIAGKTMWTLSLAVGGGSCCDYAKAVSVSVHCDDDPWEKYYVRFEEPTCQIGPRRVRADYGRHGLRDERRRG